MSVDFADLHRQSGSKENVNHEVGLWESLVTCLPVPTESSGLFCSISQITSGTMQVPIDAHVCVCVCVLAHAPGLVVARVLVGQASSHSHVLAPETPVY